ncbi:GCN5 family acetyltransferase [Scytonema hofmannii PCC 7110]|uniref:GCN5 family acetyltransferase n=1 Tax=Scytonema hofmannii PCC 7110 TaxID=128403 RepID=A0A139XBZ7_9CYAN|nr:GNAT family N-acetyltransferase [Scytonema hofmannii]KYC42220.1 GCN5 family acetyltransferase [Scytonema hofmannii PCC 7110]
MSIHLPQETPRLILRDFVESDWQGVHSYASDPEVVRYLPFGPNTKEDTKNYIQTEIKAHRKRNRQHFALAITLKEDKQFIGACRISITEPNKSEGSIGFSFAKQFWGQGYATEAGEKLLEFGFQQLKLHRIFAICDSHNHLSARVLVKIGMRQEGYLREYEWMRGEWRDVLLYAILEKDWIQMQIRNI